MSNSGMPTTPDHVNHFGQEVYMLHGANMGKRATPGDVRLLVIHHTGGTDSRAYLRANTRGVSAHYLVGLYPGLQHPRIYKYGSERYDITYTQGPAQLGGIAPGRVNDYSISIEMEGPPINGRVMECAARLAASILDYWVGQGRSLVMVTHDIIQHDKDDPALNWYDFCRMVYRNEKGA